MRKKVKKKFNGFSILKMFVFLTPFLVTAFLIFADIRLRPVVVTVAKSITQSLVTKAVNTAIIEQLDVMEIDYEDLVYMERDEVGEVTSLSYNALEVNRLKSLLVSSVIDKTNQIQLTDFYVPIGNITDIDFLQNKGPQIKFTITPSTYVEADIESKFEQTGINQVNHQIYIVLKVTSSALIPNYSTNVAIENRVCIAETIIVGKVPNYIGNGMTYSVT